MAIEDNLAAGEDFNLDELRLRTEALIDQLESIKKLGEESQAKILAFYQEHGLQMGDGLKALTSDRVEPCDQYVFLKLLSELEKAPEVIANRINEVEKPAAVAASLKALNHRYRI